MAAIIQPPLERSLSLVSCRRFAIIVDPELARRAKNRWQKGHVPRISTRVVLRSVRSVVASMSRPPFFLPSNG